MYLANKLEQKLRTLQMSKKSLLQKAMDRGARKGHNNFSDEEIELTLAWVKDEITLTQVNAALGGGRSIGSAYTFLALCSKYLLKRGAQL